MVNQQRISISSMIPFPWLGHPDPAHDVKWLLSLHIESITDVFEGLNNSDGSCVFMTSFPGSRISRTCLGLILSRTPRS
jgi:hypothetical protein